MSAQIPMNRIEEAIYKTERHISSEFRTAALQREKYTPFTSALTAAMASLQTDPEQMREYEDTKAQRLSDFKAGTLRLSTLMTSLSSDAAKSDKSAVERVLNAYFNHFVTQVGEDDYKIKTPSRGSDEDIFGIPYERKFTDDLEY